MEIKTPLLPPPPDEVSTIDQDDRNMPWSRQPGEPETAWVKFKSYRDCPRPRRLVRPGAGNTAELCRLNGEWRWEERVEAYDRHLDRVFLRHLEKAVEDDGKLVAAEHILMLRDARELSSIVVNRLLEEARRVEFATMKPGEAIKWLETVVKLTRLIHGESTENHAQVADLSGLSLDELRAAEELAAKMAEPTKH